jgi:hypothetical protein
MNRKSILSTIILLILTLNTLSVLNIKADMPYQNVTTNVTFTVSYSMDDAYDLIGYQFRNNTTLAYLKSSSYDTYTGIIFNTTTIPVGATINHAYLSLYGSDAVDSNSYLTTVYGIDEDNCGTFAVEADLTGVAITSAFANWDLSNLEGGAWANSTDLKAVVQEIINRGGWANGNALGFRLSSAQSAYGYRSFRTYDYTGLTYDPKIYITYTVSTVVSQANPWDYISDFNTNWTLLNETDGYTWWETWNVTGVKSSYGLVGAVNANQGRIYRLNFTDYADLPSGYTLWTSGCIMQFGADKLLISTGSTLYCLGFKVSNGYVYLMNSTNSGDSWNIGVSVAYGSQHGMAYDGNDKIFIVYRTGVDVYTYMVVYTISTKTLSSVYTVDPNLTSGSRVSNPVYVPSGNKFMFTICGYTNIYIFAFDMDTMTQDAVHGVTVGTAGYNPVIHPNSDSTEFYVLWYVGPLYGMTIDDDCVTHGSVETSISANVLSYNNVWFDLDYDGTKWSCIYVADANKYLYMNERVSGTWGSPVLKSGLYTMASIGYDYGSDISASNGYVTFVQSYNTLTTKDILSSTKSWGSVRQLTSIGSAIQGVDIVTVGSNVESVHQFILLDPQGNPVDEIPDYIIYQPDYLNSTYDKWLFEGEVYKIEMYVNNTDITYLTLNDTVHTLTFSYNNNTDVYKLEVINADGTLINQLVAGLISSGKTDYDGNITSIWWKFILNTNIVDCTDRDFSYILHYTNPSSPYNILLTETGLIDANITIYNLGGVIEYTFTGDGGHIVGGHPFQIYATNSTLTSTARTDIIYRRLQGVHTLVELGMDNKNDSYRLEEISNVGYFEMGIDYKLEESESGAWIEGWMCRVYIDDINVGTNFDGLLLKDRAYINTRVLWFNRGTLIRGDEKVFSYHWAYDRDFFPSQRNTITFWVDLWFDKANSSTVFGGRVNPQYYGYTEVGSAWWFNSAFKPLTNNITSSMLFDDITDSNGNIVSSKQISLVRVHCKIAKVASGGDADTWVVNPFQIMKMQLAKERMEGIDTPDFIQTQQLDIAGYGMYNILGGLGVALTNAFMGVFRLIMGGMDTFLSYFGLPYGTFSTLMNWISLSFSSLMGWLASASSVFSSMLLIFTTLVTSISNFITYTIQVILFFATDILTIPLQIIQLVIGLLNGEVVTFYFLTLDFTPYKDLMDGLKQLLPLFGSMMYATWLLFGNISFEGEPEVSGFISRVIQSFNWVRDTYSSIFNIYNQIYSEILFIYAWIKSHIPTMGGTPSLSPHAGTG